jgi:flagellar biosynthesis chaperone FliJ
LETSQKELDNERQMKMEQLSSPPEDNRLITSNYSENMQSTLILPFSASKIEDYEKQIEQLQQNLSQKDEERTLLQERLNEVELQLTKSSDDYASTIAKHELLLQERDSLVQQQLIQSTER